MPAESSSTGSVADVVADAVAGADAVADAVAGADAVADAVLICSSLETVAVADAVAVAGAVAVFIGSTTEAVVVAETAPSNLKRSIAIIEKQPSSRKTANKQEKNRQARRQFPSRKTACQIPSAVAITEVRDRDGRQLPVNYGL